MKIGVLGPAGTFSEAAAELWLLSKAEKNEEGEEIKYYETIFGVSEGVLRGEVDCGIVPIENSLEGSVGETLDVLSSERENAKAAEGEGEELRIVGEVLVPIKINLSLRTLLNLPKNLAEIKTVVSHPHALAQCKQFLREQLRGAKIKSVDSTASAAKLAAKDEKGRTAALASEEAARRYGLKIVAENVQDKESVTRFVVLSSSSLATETAPTGKDKTSVLIYLKDRPGALYEVLGEFARRGINLTKIESRPSRRAMGDYMFHIDCEGHLDEEAVRAALRGVEQRVATLKILGTYPVAK
ncbi:MAG TPA: prephenate dehydratase [Methanomicrobia archaeon]|nr:prephenate dehydratase [Methanomicrobia archaeon]